MFLAPIVYVVCGCIIAAAVVIITVVCLKDDGPKQTFYFGDD